MERKIIDVKYANIISKDSKDKVVLIGEYLDKGSNYVENLEIEFTSGVNGKVTSFKVPYSGYSFELFLGDFNGDMKDEIMLRGEFGGSGRFTVAAIYEYKDGVFEEIFNPEIFEKKFKITAEYLRDKKVRVNSIPLNEYHIYDIKNRPNEYLNIIYDKNGNVNQYVEPVISRINQAFPIKLTGTNKYYLFVRQRIVGIANSDTIGYVESFVEFTPNNNINLTEMGYYSFGEKIEDSTKLVNTKRKDQTENMSKYFPLGTIFIKPKDIGWEEEQIKLDFDMDGKDEYLIPYTLNGVPYLGILKTKNGEYSLADSYKGTGYNIKNLMIKNIKGKYYILVGFAIGGKINRLEILNFQRGKLKKAFKHDGYYYSKIYMHDLNKDGREEIILWTQDTGEAYYIDIYEFKDHKLKKTNKFDKSYYKTVVQHYKDLLNKYPGSSTYLYYLALAYQKIGDYKSALETIDKDLKAEYPYPEEKVILKLKQKLQDAK